MKKFYVYIIVIISLLPQFFNSCANTSRGPSGGPKDTIPPVLLAMNPADQTIGFAGKQVAFAFNEYVQLKDANKQFTVSPPTEKRPILKIRGKQVIVEFPSPLKENTTYFIDFGQSVVDLNESNKFDYLSMTFSTGNTIDSMIYIGRLVDALTLDPVEGAFTFLYEENIDSLPYKQKPDALARSDKDGVFIIKGLKPVNYKIIAVNDANNNFLYDPGNEKIAFSEKLINTYHLNSSDSLSYDELPMLKMFSENVRKQFLASYKQPEKRQLELIFNQQNPHISDFNVKGLTADDLILEHNRWNDTLKFWIKAKTIPDSLHATLKYMRTDSLDQLSMTEAVLKFNLEKKEEDQEQNRRSRRNENAKKETLTPAISNKTQAVYEKNVQINFKTPLINFDTTLISLFKYDLDNNKKAINFQLIQDTLYIRNYHLKAAWETSTKYELEIMPNAFTDIYELSNDSIISKFETANPDKYSTIAVNLSNAQGSYIIQLLQGKDKNIVEEKYADNAGSVKFSYLNTGKYLIRIIEDKNANRVWDTGKYLQKIQPERTAYVKFEDNTNEIDLRPNWNWIQPIDINTIFEADEE